MTEVWALFEKVNDPALHLVKYNCDQCGIYEYRLKCSSNTSCACAISPSTFSGRGRSAQRTCLCKFCHTVFHREKRQQGLACQGCESYMRANMLLVSRDGKRIDSCSWIPEQDRITVGIEVIWQRHFGAQCVICGWGPFRYDSNYLIRRRHVCDRRYKGCEQKFKHLQLLAFGGCLLRLGLYRDVRQLLLQSAARFI